MRIRYRRVLSTLTGIVLMPLLCHAAAAPILTEVPKEGEVRFGQVVYVDDGKCPAGEIKEITGGNRDKGITRKVRCVKKPDSASSR